ncbi:MAG TPA: hypothetical protein VM076_17900 [Gemmatimonadaceae bacterium]|nr:hypothetical protein [Gemmatimonadaceae bacterium]
MQRILRTLGFAAVMLTTACHVWQPATLDPAHEYLNGRARLYRTDGISVILDGPRVEGDSIVGRWPGGSARVALARSDVQRVEVSRISRGRTAVVGLGLFAMYLAAQIALADASSTYAY